MRVAALLGLLFVLLLAACSGGDPKYDVVVNFNTEVQQTDLDATNAYLRTFDDDVDFLIQESFPPVGRATVQTDADAFCLTVVTELESRPYVESVACEEQ